MSRLDDIMHVDDATHDQSDMQVDSVAVEAIEAGQEVNQQRASSSKAKHAKAAKKRQGSARDTPEAAATREGSTAATSTREASPVASSSQQQHILETDTSHVAVSSLFTSYVPGVVSDSDDDEHNGAAQHAKRGRKGKTKLREFGKAEEDEQDDRLYCVCRQLYDPDRIMICCDKCEDWYHLDCIGIKEERVELIDDFFCPLCTSRYSIETTYKRRCARPHCLHACSPLSKYCSDYCGIAVAAARISLDGLEPERLWKKVHAAQRPEARVVDLSKGSGSTIDMVRVDERRRAALVSKLDSIVAHQATLEQSISLVDKRLQYLTRAIKRWEALCQATADQLASEGLASTAVSTTAAGVADDEATAAPAAKKAKKTKAKKPTAATSLPEAQCGFDLRLVDEDQDWQEFVSSEAGRTLLLEEARLDLDDLTGVCLEPRKRCDRHQGWQKVREADFEVEKAVLIRRLEMMASKEGQLRQRLEDHDERVKFRTAHASKTGRAIDVKNHMSPSPVRKSRPSASPAKTLSTITNGKGAVANHSAAEEQQPQKQRQGEEDEMIPEDVWIFLSRTEQARLRALGRHA